MPELRDILAAAIVAEALVEATYSSSRFTFVITVDIFDSLLLPFFTPLRYANNTFLNSFSLSTPFTS